MTMYTIGKFVCGGLMPRYDKDYCVCIRCVIAQHLFGVLHL